MKGRRVIAEEMTVLFPLPRDEVSSAGPINPVQPSLHCSTATWTCFGSDSVTSTSHTEADISDCHSGHLQMWHHQALEMGSVEYAFDLFIYFSATAAFKATFDVFLERILFRWQNLDH